ncbi:MAG: hypothetical protein QOD39_1146, partial [Mycobacterium sp.]|nr:hypothetical protein [Mycobacterium sp.]
MALTTRDRIEKFADRLDQRLRVCEVTGSPRIATSSKVRVILSSCGFEKQGKRNMESIESALAARSVFPHMPLHPGPLDHNLTIH